MNERVKVVNNFGEDDFYDLVVVLMRKNNVKKILKKLSADQETLKKYIKAVKESGKVLKELGYRNKFPIKIKSFYWNPEWITAKILNSILNTKFAEIAMMMHVNSAKDEMKELSEEFILLKNKLTKATPNLDELFCYIK